VALRTRTELYRRALEVIPGGVNSPVRAMRSVGLDEPLFMRRGEGAYVEDEDGNRYVDWVMSWGPLIFGHADPETVDAVVDAARDGTSFGAPTEREVLLAEEIVEAITSEGAKVVRTDLLYDDVVWAAAGTPSSVFPIAPGDLVRAARAEPADFKE
jgi:glutamate-1-semialdehyde aminotransferase